MRARYPDQEGFVQRDGVKVHYEVFGDGDPTVMLLPTWSIVHSRHWKAQVPYLSRYYRVVTFDGRGSGLSDRPTEPEAYADDEYVADAIAVLDEVGVGQAVLGAFSRGGYYGVLFAAEHPERTLGLFTIGAGVRLNAVENRPG